MRAALRRLEVITPKDYVGALMELAQQRRGEFVDMTFLTEARTTLVYNLPLAEACARAPRACCAPMPVLACDQGGGSTNCWRTVSFLCVICHFAPSLSAMACKCRSSKR